MFAVLLGVVHQFVRERQHGRTARDDNFSVRVLRAIATGLILNATYLVVAGPWLADLLGGGRLTPIRHGPLGLGKSRSSPYV